MIEKIDFESSEDFEFENKDVIVQILAGGKGLSLQKVINGIMPKSLVEVSSGKTILDLVLENLRSKGFSRFVYSLGLEDGCFGKEIYKYLQKEKLGLECVFEKNNLGNARSVKRLSELTECKYPILVVCSDMLLPWDVMSNAVKFHKKNTITWITSSLSILGMERYHGLKVREDGAVIYDVNLTPEGKYLDDGKLYTVTKGGSIIIDPVLFLEIMEKMETTDKFVQDKSAQMDIFWDVIPFIERHNQQRIANGDKSILYAVIGKDPVMDIGSPERLNLVRKYLEQK